MKHSTDIGTLNGTILVFGGVYSNLHALEALHGQALRLGIPPERIICTGDVAGYCAFPDECFRFLEDWGIHVIAGNVEENLRDGLDDCGCGFGEDSRCDLFSRMWYPYTKKHTGERALRYISQLPAILKFQYAGRRACVLHGSAAETAEFVWQSTEWPVKAASFGATESDLILAGHSGVPFVDEQDKKTWLNAGVIGMPANDGTTDVWYLTLDDKDGELNYDFHRLEYDFTAARAAMLARPLPKSYALTLKNGLWDNTEIMPAAEAERTGVRIRKIHLGGALRDTSEEILLRDASGEILPGKAFEKLATSLVKKKNMSTYYDPKDLKKFGQIKEYQEEMGEQFFDWYENATHGDTALTQREKALIALAVSHAVQCPYCIDAYTTASLESGADEEQMMEAVHVAAAVKAGTTLIYGLQMKRQIEKLTM